MARNAFKTAINYQGNLVPLFLIPLFGFAIITVAGIIFYFRIEDIQNLWQGWSLGKAGQYAEYCERNRMTEVIRQPMNSWSNLAFLFFGLVCITFAWFDSERPAKSQSNFLIQNPIFSILFGLSLAYLCVGSFFYHASLTSIGQRFDMSGVYAVTTLPIIYNLLRTVFAFRVQFVANRNRLRKRLALFGVVLVLTVDILFYVFKWYVDGKVMLPLLIVLILISTIGYHRRFKVSVNYALLTITAISMLLAGTLWILDREKVMCDPDSHWQGHAVWHVLTAFSSFSLYLLFRNEKTES